MKIAEQNGQFVKKKVVKEHGYANGWNDTPEAVEKCREERHIIKIEKPYRCVRVYICEQCGIKYSVDSGD